MLGASATSAVSILHNLGLLALVAIGISMLQPSRMADTAGWRRSTLMGVVFGTTASFVMLDPVTLAPGATFDARGGPAMLAGIYGGPIAAVVTALMGSATRAWVGGAGAPGGMLGFAVYAAVGLAARHYLTRNRRRPDAAWFLGFALVGTVCVLPSFFVYPEWQTGISILKQAWWLLLTGNLVGVLVLGTLLEQDRRRRILEDDLRETEARTRSATEAKTRFLASMSHEIRTPMNAVVGFVDLLRDSSLDTFQRRCAEQIREAAQGLLRIIDDILDFAKIDAGNVLLEPQPVDPATLAESCRTMLMPQFEAKGLACTLDLADTLPAAVEADPIRLRQVLLNLLGNAVKFTDAGGVAVSLRYVPGPAAGSGELVVVVADTGIGMTGDERTRLFSPFAQGDHIGRGGTGLGLVISRMLVEAMGGNLALDSAPGEGTTVTVRIPAAEATAPPVRPGDDRARVARASRSLRVLVAEDVALNAEMIQATLEQAQHSVHVVSDGQHAVDAVAGSGFDIVLMDVQMPVMDGLAATRAIRAMGGAVAATPIIALTAYASREDLKACLDAGMNDFLSKPLERAKLQAILERWGGGRGDQAPAVGGPAARPATGNDSRTGADGRSGVDGGSGGDGRSGEPQGDENVERIGELLERLARLDREERDTMRSLAVSLVSAAENVGFPALAERSRRLVAASGRSNAEALGALIEDVTDTGRRALQGATASTGGNGR